MDRATFGRLSCQHRHIATKVAEKTLAAGTRVKRAYRKKEVAPPNTVDTTTAFGELPPRHEWNIPRKSVGTNARGKEVVTISNTVTADLVADACIPEGSEGKVIIEGFPGK